MKKIKNYPTAIDLLVIIGVFTITTAIVGVLWAIVALVTSNASNTQAVLEDSPQWLSIISYVIPFTLTIIFAAIYRKKRIKLSSDPSRYSLNLRKQFAPASALYILWGYLLLMAIGVLIDPIVSLFPDSYAQLQEAMDMPLWSLVLLTVIAAPLLEEVLFRGIIMSDLRAKYGTFVAIIVSAAIFGVIHINVVQVIAAFFSGIVLGYIFHISGSIWSVVSVHMLNNLTSVVIYMFTPSATRNQHEPIREFIGIDWIYYTIFGLSTLLVVVASIRIYTIKRAEDKARAIKEAESVLAAIESDSNTQEQPEQEDK